MEQNINLSLDKTSAVICEECGNHSFIEGTLLRKASRFLTGTSTDALIPIPLFYCTKCAHTNEEFLPIQLKAKTE
jgi:hypothetical protein